MFTDIYGPIVHNIPVSRWSEFCKKIDSLNKKAKKNNWESISVPVLTRSLVKIEVSDVNWRGEVSNRNAMVECYRVVLMYNSLKMNGYDFLARVEYLADNSSVLFHTVPGSTAKVDERIRSLNSNICEHCNKIRNRRDTFVVMNVETGDQKQVGRQCLGDYLGVSADMIANKFSQIMNIEQTFKDLEDVMNGGALRRAAGETIDVMKALVLTSAYIEMFGWVPRSSEFGKPTASWVYNHFSNVRLTEEEQWNVKLANGLAANVPLHEERAIKTLEWVKTELAEKDNQSDYEQNLVTLLTKTDVSEEKHLGLICSAVSAYQRAMNQKIEYAKKNEEAMASNFVGNVKDRLKDISATVSYVKSMSSDYGPMTLIKLIDNDNNIFCWFASGSKDFVIGQGVKFTGTVKSHNEFRGVKETQLTRVNIT